MFVEFFENTWETKTLKCQNHNKWGPKVCKMMSWFQTWPQNSNRITFDPFLAKKVSEVDEIVFYQSSTVFGPKKMSNVIRFEFWCQIWNKLIILHMWDPICYDFDILNFGLPCIFENFNEHAGPLNIFRFSWNFIFGVILSSLKNTKWSR